MSFEDASLASRKPRSQAHLFFFDTQAQWIWCTNLLCFLVHTFMVFLTLHMAYWRWDRSMWKDTEHVTVYIYRVTQIPTAEMLGNREWSPGWNNRSMNSGNEWYMRENDMPINFATLTLSFFAISAFFHLWACVVGLFDRFSFIYWRQMDDCFCWWRWLEYSMSASVMGMAIAISIGIREQSILASIFVLHFTTQCFGFLTEYISVPKTVVHKRISQDQLQMNDDGQNKSVGDSSGYYVATKHTSSFMRRMVPHLFGYFPITTAWVIIITHLEWARHDLSLITDLTIPSWVDGMIYGTVLIFWSFAVVQIIFQSMKPTYYWGSELIYCFLSLTSKLYLGVFLLVNVIFTDGTVEQALVPAKSTSSA